MLLMPNQIFVPGGRLLLQILNLSRNVFCIVERQLMSVGFSRSCDYIYIYMSYFKGKNCMASPEGVSDRVSAR